MSYRQEEKELAALNLLEKVIDEQSNLKIGASKLGAHISSTDLIGHVERVSAIIVTSGALRKNKELINALKALNLELIDEFPSQEMIEFLVHNVLNKYYEAVGEHFSEWEKTKMAVVAKTFGTYSIIEPKLLGGIRKWNQKRKSKKNFVKNKEFSADESLYED